MHRIKDMNVVLKWIFLILVDRSRSIWQSGRVKWHSRNLETAPALPQVKH